MSYFWEGGVGQVNTEDHESLHEFCTAVETDSEEIIVLSKPYGMVA